MSSVVTPPLGHSLPQVAAQNASKVFIFGAGASAADGAPLQAHLFRKYAEIVQSHRNDYVHAASEGEMRTFFDLFWGADIDSTNLSAESFPTFEEALDLLELANARGECFKAYGGLPHQASRAHEARAHLISLIATVIAENLRHASVHHQAFVQALANLGWLNSTDFVSLNYDLLLDNALSALAPAAPDYAISFRNPSPPSAGTRIPKLLKIHGSLNWLFCPTCNQIDLFPGEKIAAEIVINPGLMTCPVCQEPRTPIVIPPTFFKAMSNFYLQQIWKSAEETLLKADHIIFCGYSYPDADLHFKYLIKRSEINRVSGARPPEVFIVNEHAGKDVAQREAERDRFVRFFRNKGLVHLTKLSFSDLAADPTAYAASTSWI